MNLPEPAVERRAPPLSLYVHLPWCISKCPYCDFNSHALGGTTPFDPYVDRLIADLEADLDRFGVSRPLQSIFIGGGTPSLFPGKAIHRLLAGIAARIELAADAEVTLEANPGAADAGRFAAYREAGVNRLSIGVQSLSASHLERLGRIHDPTEACAAVRMARTAGFDNLNLDFMFGLPGQLLQAAAEDLDRLIALEPEHLSYYQLTLEPNTRFFAHPPQMPDVDLAADIGEQGAELLGAAGYGRYEVSAYARPGRCCRHNLGYWRFGDYLGIGAGAHGKLTKVEAGETAFRILRTAKHRDPDRYLGKHPEALISTCRELCDADVIFEFALNAMRLTSGFERSLFTAMTGLPWLRLEPYVAQGVERGLVEQDGDRLCPTQRGRDFLDDLVGSFLSPPTPMS
ncbi:radical SAM family heme chaperone HemW [Thiorhodococcus mannitoliphagus]|uniref:Heme chaperone HemW n=1 Tax=Thiorhodococcus mannitoliphagus TaxID=329406 RepID=A0A6P1DTI6_9GAMM|nr:radical SAM family heme chaperone HemW [Thiorhodococcus mannitoliphagus]NEX21428.1 radical SAM family heme chaperone HemW [Thiorhodococcus mannitoliphagus]